MASCGTSPTKVTARMSRSWRSAAASAMPVWLASASVPSIISVSGVTPSENAAPNDDSRIAAASRLIETATVGCSGGYSVQFRTATSRARASCSRLRVSSADSWDTWATRLIMLDAQPGEAVKNRRRARIQVRRVAGVRVRAA